MCDVTGLRLISYELELDAPVWLVRLWQTVHHLVSSLTKPYVHEIKPPLKTYPRKLTLTYLGLLKEAFEDAGEAVTGSLSKYLLRFLQQIQTTYDIHTMNMEIDLWATNSLPTMTTPWSCEMTQTYNDMPWCFQRSWPYAVQVKRTWATIRIC